ncbi:LYR motif-containing protein 4 isoform X1 [Diorhabda sublineata]|uniref:LYR motif-containing protein 4 isoform X1 n=1 Tax=Diorhabda sublineata TaxID=1163346 RepID=UPI0024E171E4|nr:LYR motif-containing protein 4 isoform X1 [Diorhabda sublineata]
MSKPEVLKLFKSMIRESKKISSYNFSSFREYAIRRIRDGFKENKILSNPKEVQIAIQKAQSDLDIIKRQVIVGQLYSAEKLVIEHHLKN